MGQCTTKMEEKILVHNYGIMGYYDMGVNYYETSVNHCIEQGSL